MPCTIRYQNNQIEGILSIMTNRARGQTATAYTLEGGVYALRDNANITKETEYKEDSNSRVQCTNIFKNQNTISDSLTSIWTEIINTLENTGSMAHNNNIVQSSTHYNLEKDEVRK